MPREYNLKTSKDRRAVLRSMVAENYKLIDRYYTGDNILKCSKQEISNECIKINGKIGDCFLENCDIVPKNWQDYLSEESLFDLFLFQSKIVNEIQKNKGSYSSEKIQFLIDKVASHTRLVPKVVKFEEERVGLTNSNIKQNFVESFKNRIDVLTYNFLKRDNSFNEKEFEDVSQQIKDGHLVGVYSNYVAEEFLKEKKEEVCLYKESLKDNVVAGINFSKQVGFDEYGGSLYENENGSSIVSSNGEIYDGVILDKNSLEYENEKETNDSFIKREDAIVKGEDTEQLDLEI